MSLARDSSPGFLLGHATLRRQRTMAATLTPLDVTHPNSSCRQACTGWTPKP
jgi:hypothetical protein